MNRIDRLLAEMTLEEKIGQLSMLAAGFSVTGPVLGGDTTGDVRTGRAGSLLNVYGPEATRRIQRVAVEESRLAIPLLLGFDAVHGHRTVFPLPIGEAAAFDPDLWEETARASAAQAAADGVKLTFAPMIDIARDPRWGRIAESPGEDPLLASLFGEAKIRGFQGEDLHEAGSVAATAKHFVAYGAANAGRDYASTDLSERTLRETYLPPFVAAVDAGVAAVMPAFSDLAGVPLTADERLIGGWLRGEAGFEGVVISDYNAVAELVVHGVAADPAEAAALALRAGVDIDMMSHCYRDGLPEALDRGLVSLPEIERSVRRVLALKERLGLFETPHAADRPQPGTPSPDALRELAREAAVRSIVLLEHRGDVLPLDARPQRIAMVGPLADARAEMLGCWSGAGDSASAVSFFEGLALARPDCDIRLSPGVGIRDGDESGIAAALDLCAGSDVVLLCLGESRDMSGEAASRSDLDLPGIQRRFAEAVLALGKPMIVLLSAGRPLCVPWLAERADALLMTWFLGHEAGNAVADILTGRRSPTGRLPVSWPRTVGQVPLFYAERPTGRPASAEHYTSKYIDGPTAPLYPFGHGLTYGRFRLGAVVAEPADAREGDMLTVTIELTNEGPLAGEETVFLFVRKPVSRVSRARLEMKGFGKLALASGETGRLTLVLPVEALRFLDAALRPAIEHGAYELLVGPSADRARLVSYWIEVGAA
ncbi:glycoside hydrolase family 3 N-terminal domain-containing protein [Aureimonas sp. AU12]|uniref:glycoside hydrolase family 3 N-terminal domain-containing protein n=1 Tax=Aureimonas sp. AU12 TaxID=1638161 RepID=UPI0007831665|nr:glycoside hydrolase family 3 N-terminal domain-containing protein [Aureimonas sp. AU12]